MKITRKELFEAVWATPVTRLAKNYGISDVGLAKACRGHAIELPPRGYWAKKAAGKSLPKPVLSGNPDGVVEFSGQPSLRRVPLSSDGKSVDSNAIAKIIERRPPDIQRWTRKTLAVLKQKPNVDGAVSSHSQETFSVCISPASRERVIGILNCIEFAAAQLGVVWVPDEMHNRIVGVIGDQKVAFEIRERYKTHEHIERHAEYRWLDKKTYSYTFLHELVFRIEGCYDGRKSWACGKTRTLEQKLPSVIEGILAAAEAMHHHMLERQERERQWREQRAKWEEEERIAREERAFREAIVKEAAEWSQADLIRRYVVHLRSKAAERNVEFSEEGRMWLARLEQTAERMDPANRRLCLPTRASAGVDEDSRDNMPRK